MHHEILPIEEAADRAEISRKEVDRWARDGEIRKFHKRKDRKTYVDLEEVLRRKAGFLSGGKHGDSG